MLAALMLVPFASQAQVIVEIGESTSTTTQYSLPVNMYFNYSLTQQIFTADEIGVAGTINSIAFEYAYSSSFSMSSVKVYMKNVTKSEFETTTDMEAISSTDLVWEGTLSATEAGWVTLTLTSPFVYDGTSNLLVCCFDDQNGYPGSSYKFRTTTTGSTYRGIAYYSDSYTPSIADVTTFSGSKTRYQYRNNIRLGITPSGNYCAKPATLVASNVTSDGATITWANTSANSYQFEYKTSDDTTWTVVTLTDTTYTLTTLSANTEYEVRVKAICGTDSESAYKTASFRTACAAISTLPYTMGFEATEIPATTPSIDAFPFCWTRINDATSTSYNYYPYSYSSNARTGSRDLYFYSSTSTTYATNQLAVLPQLDVTLPVNTLQLSFWVRGGTSYGSNLEVGTMSDPTDNTTFTTVQTIAVPVGSTYENHVVYFMNAASTDRYIAFRLVRGSSTQYAYVDDVVLDVAPSCFLVSNASVDSISGTSAILSWNDNFNTGATYSIYNMADTSLIASGITPVPGANAITYTVTGLAGNTTYNLGIVANCSATDASEYAVVSFHTACVTIATLPYTMGFEADEIPATTPNAQAFPYCWTRINDATSTSSNYYPYSYSSNARTGSRDLYFYSSTSSTYATNQLAVLPQLDVTLPVNTLQLSFWVRGSTSYGANLEVGTMSDPTDMTTFTTVETIVVPASATYENHIVYFLNANATDSYIAFRLVKGTSTQYAYVDDLVLDEAPTCFPVSNLTAFDITTSSVTLSWTDNMNNGATYSIAANGTVVATGITADSGSSIVSYTVTGLNAATIYTFSVVANCSADDASTPVEVSIMTPASLPYTTDFETGNAEWLLVNGANGWTVGEGVNNGGSHALYISNDENGTYAYTNTTTSWSYAARPFALNDSNYYVLNFDWKANGESTWDYLRAWLIPGNYAPEAGGLNGATSTSTMNNAVITGWIDLNPATGKLNLQTDWQSVDDTLLLEPGVYTVLLMWANDGSGGTQPPAAVDNFSFVEYVPVPLTVTNLHGDAIAHNAFTAVWNGSDRQTEWHIAIEMPGDSVLTWQTVAERSVPFFGLTPNTAYNVYVTCQEPLLGTLGDTVMATITTNDLPNNCAVIAEGTTTNGNAPVYGYYADAAQRVQSIYPASMLTSMVGQTYTSMHYFVSSGSSANWGNGTWIVRMGITTQENLADGFDTTALTTYYTGNLSASTTDGMTITFDQPFTYNGGNLVVEFEQPTASGYTSCYFYGTSATSGSRRGYGSGYSNVSVQNFLPQVQFCAPYTTTCFNIDHLVVENVTTTTADVYWYPGNVETAWQIAYGTGAVNDSILLAEAVSTTSNVMTLTGLTSDMDYWFYVRPVCDSNTYGNWTSATFATLPTCGMINPANILVENLTNNSVTFTVNGELDYGTMHHFTVDYWTEGGDTVTAVSTGNSVVLNNLQSNTTYYVTFTANCNANGTDNSRVIGPYNFNTACDAIAIPFVEDFEAESTTLSCWTIQGEGSWSIGTGDYSTSTGAYTGTSNARITHSSTGNVTKLVSPVLDGTENGVQLQFAHVQRSWAGDIDELRVYYRESDSSAWQILATYTSAYATWTPETMVITNPVYQVAFEMTDNYGYGVGIDAVSITNIPACVAPSNVVFTGADSTQIAIAWEGDSTATYGIINMADSSLFGTISGNSAVINSLTPNTQYTIGVYTVCVTGNSDTVTVIARTACGAVAIPFTEDFEESSNTIGCWTVANIDANSGLTSDAYSGSRAFRFSYNTNPPQYIFSPELSGTEDGVKVEFMYKVQSTNYPESFQLGYSTTTNDSSAFIWSTEQTNLTNTSYVSYSEIFSTPNIKYISIKYTANDMYYLFIDSVVFSLPPSCLPAAVTVDAVTENSVTINWTGNAASYGVYNDTTLVATVTTNTYTFTGLTAATSYTFGVQAICSATDIASMTTVTAMTACADVTALPYTEGFENGLGCWTTVNGSSDGVDWNAQPSFSSGAITPHTGNYMAASWSWNSVSMHANAWLISPKFVLPTVNAGDTLNFSWWDRTSAAYPDSYSVVLSTTTNDTAAFTTIIRPYGMADTTGWGMQTVDLTAYAGQSIYIAFHHVDYDMNYLLIDDISLTIGAAPAPLPDSMQVTIAVNDATMGTTNPAPGVHYFYEGDTASVIAVPNTGYHLTGWSFIMNVNGIPYYDTTINVAVTNFFDIFTGGWVVEHGDNIYSFSITANFAAGEPELDTVTVNITVTNPLEGTTNPAPGTNYFTTGDTLSVVALPNTGYSVAGWILTLIDETGDTIYNNMTIPMAVADVFSVFQNTLVAGPQLDGYVFDVTPIFAFDTNIVAADSLTVILAVNDATMGTTTPAPGTYYYGIGDTLSFSVSANDGYHFENAIIALMYNGITMFADTIDDITEIAQVSNVVVDSDMVGMAINVLVNFAPNAGPQPTYWTVTLSSADTTMGTVSPEGETQVADGASFTATATANEGYRFVAWQSGQTLVSDQAEFTFTVVASTALVAVFEVDTGAPTQYFHVTGNVNDPAMGYVTVGESTNNTALVADGETVTLTAHANEGYHFVRWSTGETTESIDITVDGEDVTVTAIFEENVGIDDVDENDVTIYSTDSKIVVRGAEGSAVYVFDVNGRLVSNMANATETVEFRMANTGVYLVKVGAAPAKRVLVVR